MCARYRYPGPVDSVSAFEKIATKCLTRLGHSHISAPAVAASARFQAGESKLLRHPRAASVRAPARGFLPVDRQSLKKEMRCQPNIEVRRITIRHLIIRIDPSLASTAETIL